MRFSLISAMLSIADFMTTKAASLTLTNARSVRLLSSAVAMFPPRSAE